MPNEGGTSCAATHFDLQKHTAFIFALTITQILKTFPRTTAEKESWGSVVSLPCRNQSVNFFHETALGNSTCSHNLGQYATSQQASRDHKQQESLKETALLLFVCLFFNKTTSCVWGASGKQAQGQLCTVLHACQEHACKIRICSLSSQAPARSAGLSQVKFLPNKLLHTLGCLC